MPKIKIHQTILTMGVFSCLKLRQKEIICLKPNKQEDSYETFWFNCADTAPYTFYGSMPKKQYDPHNHAYHEQTYYSAHYEAYNRTNHCSYHCTNHDTNHGSAH